MKKISLLCLTIIIAANILFISCTEKDLSDSAMTSNNNGDTIDTISEETTVDPTELREAIDDGLPVTDYDGYEFRIYAVDEQLHYVFASEQNGEVINDAVYAANLAIEERFNIKFVNIPYNGNTTPTNPILGGDDVYDIAEMHDISAANASLMGYFVNINELNHIDYDKPWWPENVVESLTVEDQMYLVANTISYRPMAFFFVIYANKTIMNNYNIEVPYNDVFNGSWNIDQLISMSRDIYEDINGNNERDSADLYGFYHYNYFRCILESFGINVVEKDNDTVLRLAVNDDKTQTLVEKMYRLLFETTGGYFTVKEEDGPKFQNDQVMFTYGPLYWAEVNYRYSEVDYGILPVPKLNDHQENYYSGYTTRPVIIPITNPDLDRTGLIIEAMSAEGYKKVYPAYYEVAFKAKYSQDTESARVLDIIYDGSVLDFAYMYMSTYSNTLATLFGAETPSADFTSYYASTEQGQQAILDGIITKFRDMKK